MAELKEIADTLARLYWSRPANEAETVAMAGEMERDSAAIAPPREGQGNVFFAIEPSTYYALMAKEAEA
ncbi:hypothetical protein [Rhizobium sp. C4]|uniref:hypothetical protein n=1 Tax=Rhizobium sp. C4 TaxID=1349800 RepID=UPI001E5F11B0|nr:hypothetical protein [Rhizobium sp. C4]MCD2175754.1 hypothetical protein [Rhizobium sp. C4]